MKNKKKIDIVVKYFYPVAAGIETNMLETYSDLVKRGWDVTIHTSNLDYTSGEILKNNEKIRGIDVFRYKLTKFGFFPRPEFNQANIIALHNFDIFPHLWILVYSLIRKLFGRKKYKLVLTPHGGFNPEWSIFSLPAAVVKFIYHYTLGVLLINNVVDGVRAVSDWERQEMINKGISSSKIRVISNGIEDEAFANLEMLASGKVKNKVKKIGDYIVQIGRIYPIKNYETTIRALAEIDKNIKFVIVGPTSSVAYRNKLIKLSKQLGVEERVMFFGVIRGIDKYYLIKKARMMVHMALWESFCNVVHEGMSQGLPVIVADNTALPYLVKDGINGYLVDTKDYKRVAERVNFVFKNRNSEEIRKVGKLNKKLARKHAWKNVARKMDVFYKLLLSI